MGKSVLEKVTLAVEEGRRLLGYLADGTPVFTKLGQDHLANHRDVVPLLPEVFGKLSMGDFYGKNLAQVVDLGRVVGVSTRVKTTEQDTIVYARRKGRKDGCTRFVEGVVGTACNTVAVFMYLNDYGLVALTTAFIGELPQPEPCTPSGRKDVETWKSACEFWRHYALCWDGEVEEGRYTEEDFFGVAPEPTSS